MVEHVVSRSRSIQTRRRGAGGAQLALVTGVGILIVIGAVVGLSLIRADERRAQQQYGQTLADITGLSRPARNALAREFADADKDGVADAPTDPARQLDPPELVFSYVASERNTPEMGQTFKPLTDALAAATGRPVRYLPVGDVDAQLSAVHAGQLHLTAFNTGAVPNAVDAAGFVPVALLGGDGGPSTYQLKLLASTKSGIKSVEGLRGRELALTEMSSNSGFKAPLVLLQRDFKMRPGVDFGIRYSLGQNESIEGLASGTFDAVAVAGDVLARAEQAGQIRPEQYRVLYTSDSFPTACFGYNHNLKPELAQRVRDALVSATLTDPALAAFFAPSGQTKLVPVDYAKQFALVREIDDTIGYEHKLRPAGREEAATMPAGR